MNREQLRDELKRMKKMDLAQFRREMNTIHTRAYELAQKHYHEAMYICLTPKQQQEVIAKAGQIREEWDHIREITVEDTA